MNSKNSAPGVLSEQTPVNKGQRSAYLRSIATPGKELPSLQPKIKEKMSNNKNTYNGLGQNDERINKAIYDNWLGQYNDGT